MRFKMFCALACFAAPMPVLANGVAIENLVFVERVTTAEDGSRKTALEKPNIVVPGDSLVFVLNYRNSGSAPANQFVITNPLPSAVQYQRSGDDGAVVSVDGGKSWGTLDTLRVRDDDGTQRSASDADVTHVRWSFSQPIPAGGTGKILFRGKVK